jgi:hypothetical protein
MKNEMAQRLREEPLVTDLPDDSDADNRLTARGTWRAGRAAVQVSSRGTAPGGRRARHRRPGSCGAAAWS